jgi:pimeloyl-ACP methyl ester carboxylesterase
MEGYLVLHGKKSGPSYPACTLHPVVDQLKTHSLVDFESHAWAYERLYDEPFESCLVSIKQARQRLIDAGASRVHLLSHSLGGNASIYYATHYQDFDSMILIAPAHNTHLPKIKAQTAWSIRKAKASLEQGINEYDHYIDFDSGDVTVSRVMPSIYISYFDPTGPCNMTENASRIPTPMNVLCISGQRDATQTTARDLVYDVLPKTNQSNFMSVDEDHFSSCRKSHDWVVDWVNQLT